MKPLLSMLILIFGLTFSRPALCSPVTVQSFGGVCNGTADDTTALASWAAAAAPYSTLALYGSCTSRNPISFPSVDHVQITGKGSITYKGSDTSVDIITIGTSVNGCSVNDWFVSDISVHSTTNMTGGDAIRANDICDSRFMNVNAGRLLNGEGTLYNAIHLNGGNTFYFNGGGASGKNVAMIVNGDTSVQFTDFFMDCTTLLGSGIGLEVGGNVGGLNLVCGDILENNVDLQIDRSVVNVANSQIFLGPNLALDVTTGGNNHNLYVTDPGSSNSLLFTSGTWIASAANDCVTFAPGVDWRVHMSGGTVYNCGGAGVYTASAGVVLDLSGVMMDHIGNYALNNPAAIVTKCAVALGSQISPAKTFGTIGSSC